ncbi:hypothetical protein [Streptomyces sp. NPDC006668]|uniref:hypothetical protein n=1 Tax=Streptomyces sp. NPDC006668 TaxID=3156903 RepID=UPI003406C47F
MSIRGNVAAAAVTTGVILLLAGCSSAAPAVPTSEQVKASAQARLDASRDAGRVARANLKAVGKTPDETQCQAAWDNLLDSEQKTLRRTMWMIGCAEPATP